MIRGRKITDCIIRSEAAALATNFHGDSFPAWWFSDIKDAFPSMSREWILFVLTAMGLPAFFVGAIACLFQNCVHYVCIGGRTFGHFDMQSGTKQGARLVLFSSVCAMTHGSENVFLSCQPASAPFRRTQMILT
jgi:hypothetical protein